ncbi:conserved hypothetical protein [Cupriavidus taiwanensis]|nr:conserved hypothetical protein [Cupriavidus taiwanensis]
MEQWMPGDLLVLRVGEKRSRAVPRVVWMGLTRGAVSLDQFLGGPSVLRGAAVVRTSGVQSVEDWRLESLREILIGASVYSESHQGLLTVTQFTHQSVFSAPRCRDALSARSAPLARARRNGYTMTDSHFQDAMNWSLGPHRRSGWDNRYFMDTKFSDFQTPEVLSIAIVGENGYVFYGERTDFSETRCSDFVRALVIPQFGRCEERAMNLAQLREELCDWIAGIPAASKPVLCYDHTVDLDMLRVLLSGRLPTDWRFENIRGQLDPARPSAYFFTVRWRAPRVARCACQCIRLRLLADDARPPMVYGIYGINSQP